MHAFYVTITLPSGATHTTAHHAESADDLRRRARAVEPLATVCVEPFHVDNE